MVTRKRKTEPQTSDEILPEIKVEKQMKIEAPIDRENEKKKLTALFEQKSLGLLCGPIGCGKTKLVKEMSQEMKLGFNVFQMSDQLDARALFGFYHCTDVLGEFVWKSSDFTRALSKEGIILLEDLELAPVDLISSIMDLCRERSVKMVSGEFIHLNGNCKILASMRSDITTPIEVNSLLASLPFRVTLPAFAKAELLSIINSKYPGLLHVSSRLVEIFEIVSAELMAKQPRGRQLISKDLFRACKRIENLRHTEKEKVLMELIDTWVMFVTNKELALKLAKLIGGHFTIPETQTETMFRICKPDISPITANPIHVGRIALPKHRTNVIKTKNISYGMTKDLCQLMERIAACVYYKEPILLSGETGVGKTSGIQTIAKYLNANLKVVNLSQHSESSDLIGGYKPVSQMQLLLPVRETFLDTFKKSFDFSKNERLLKNFDALIDKGRWDHALEFINMTAQRAIKANKHIVEWAKLKARVERMKISLESSTFPFAYIKGIVAEAAEKGDWLLVDEINLSSSECLDAIVHVLDETVKLHKDFRLFACMNPATDEGKRNLPVGVRSRFTEFYVHETDEDSQLAEIVKNYIPSIKASEMNIVIQFYKSVRVEFPGMFSLRNLCRSLSVASDNIYSNVMYSIYDAISMAFTSNLSIIERAKMVGIIEKFFSKKEVQIISPLEKDKAWLKVEGYYIKKGNNELKEDARYVITKSVKENLGQVARLISSGRFPTLLEGETSAGKTSMILYLAKITGNKVHRINNHEYTDIQEYIGNYQPNEEGKLQFKEGALLEAVRRGEWVILDELNLAPSDVLEALNRLLDDNRELFVSETNETVKAHPNFRLFATQNPVGSYAGRKRLSRAFLNRFVVLRFDHVPMDELVEIIEHRCIVPKSNAVKMVQVLTKLRNRRSLSGIFSASDGLMTLRDVFRWAHRLAASGDEGNDWKQCLADHGYFLLAGRCRKAEDEVAIIHALEEHFRVKINLETLFSQTSVYMPKFVIEAMEKDANKNIILTEGMRRMLVLAYQAWRFDEPVLLVGETGCGKTTLSQLLSSNQMLSINCHERTETSDFLGRIRPMDGAFKWVNGVVVEAMLEGKSILIDEISLAADSVLERLNPLLESSRQLILNDSGDTEAIIAKEGFQIIATMNPGGDYGKKELSKALRNRFTEVWCKSTYTAGEYETIIQNRHNQLVLKKLIKPETLKLVSGVIVKFFSFFNDQYKHIFRFPFSIRDIVSAGEMFEACYLKKIDTTTSVYHSFCSTLFDSFGIMAARNSIDIEGIKVTCLSRLTQILSEAGLSVESFNETVSNSCVPVQITEYGLSIQPFEILMGKYEQKTSKTFSFDAPTCNKNILRLARALLVNKPIMLEGSPGAGKSSTVMALADATGHKLIRLNLSDQTDLCDLFGSDIPITVEDGTTSFQWQDGPVLKAIKEGCWILLDEMNLASQSVLEGLNSCFDHRKELYIAELSKTFDIGDSDCRFFACQNPKGQGGGRRALPKSFINRFTSIYVDELTPTDFELVLQKSNPHLSQQVTAKMVALNSSIVENISKGWFPEGSPFEFNLRDLLRWANCLEKDSDISKGYQILYMSRMRNDVDRTKMKDIYESIFEMTLLPLVPVVRCVDDNIWIGNEQLGDQETSASIVGNNKILLSSQLSTIQKLLSVVNSNWLALLVGPSFIGKRTLVEVLASMHGRQLKHMRLTANTDALELLGSYEHLSEGLNFTALKNEYVKTIMHLGMEPSLIKEAKVAEDVLQLRLNLQCILAIHDEGETKEALATFELQFANSSLRFEWKNSVFLNAYLNGDWIILENVNCCSGAVLDRLNTCLESDGELTLPEHSGDGDAIIKAHKNFRVFFTMNPQFGTLSRAMRNRSVEMFVGEDDAWWNNINDKLNLMPLKVYQVNDHEISTRAAPLIGNLNVVDTLNFAAITKKLGEDILSDDIDMESDMEHTTIKYLVPSNQLANQFPEWQTQVWRFVSKEDQISGILWCLFSFNGKDADGFYRYLISTFDQVDKGTIDGLVQNFKTIQGYVDRRIFKLTNDPIPTQDRILDDISMNAFSIWCHDNVKNLDLSESSYYTMSCKANEGQLTINKTTSPVLLHIAPFVNELVKFISSSKNHKEKDVVEFIDLMTKVVLFVQCNYEDKSEVFGLWATQIVWESINHGVFTSLGKDLELSRLRSRINEFWSKEDRDNVAIFNEIRKTYAICNPYEEANEGVGLKHALLANNHAEMASRARLDNTLRGSSLIQSLDMVTDCTNFRQLIRESDIECSQFPGLLFAQSIEWVNEGDERIFYLLSFLNSDCGVLDFVSADKNISIVDTPIVSELMSNIWKNLRFNNSFKEISLGDFEKSMANIKQFYNIFWSNCRGFTKLSVEIRNELVEIVTFYYERSTEAMKKTFFESILRKLAEAGNQNSDSFWSAILSVGLHLVKSFNPPMCLIDPLLFDQITVKMWKAQLTLTSRLVDVFNNYMQLTTNFTDKEAFKVSQFPLLHGLLAKSQSTTNAIEELDVTDQYYRPAYAVFEDMKRELRNFTSLVVERYQIMTQHIVNEDWRSQPTESIRMLKNQVNSFVLNVAGFKNLCQNYTDIPDLIVPYLSAINIFCLSANVFCSRMSAYLENLEITVKSQLPKDIDLHNLIKTHHISDSLRKWMISEWSLLPIQFQYRFVLNTVNTGATYDKTPLDWVYNKWKLWHEAHNEKIKKLFVYRQKGVAEGDEEAIDEEDFDIKELLPDYSNEEFLDETIKVSDEALINEPSLNGQQMIELLYAFIGEDIEYKTLEADNLYLPALYLTNHLIASGRLNIDNEESTIDGHIINIHKMIKSVETKTQSVEMDSKSFNVYHDNIPKETLNSITAVKALQSRILELKEEYDDNSTLIDILDCIEKYLGCSSNLPLMLLASRIEKILDVCETWQKIADRAHSILVQTEPLKKLLLEWRKMEVLCWKDIIKRVHFENNQMTFLQAFPLIDSFHTCLNVAKDKKIGTNLERNQNSAKNLLAALIDWLNNSTLTDYQARLKSATLLSKYIQFYLKHHKVKNPEPFEDLIQKMYSVERHFRQFEPVITRKLKDSTSMIENDLKEFVDLLRFNDLNLWSVKASIKKAHGQLFNFVKRYKVVCKLSILDILDIPMEPEYEHLLESDYDLPKEALSKATDLVVASKITKDMLVKMVDIIKRDDMIHLISFVMHCDKLIKTSINYVGTDEEKEKQQGRAVFDRQKMFSLLIKKCTAIGLNSRKGMTVNAEKLSIASILEVQMKYSHENDIIEKLLRHAASSRNALVKLTTKANDQIKPFVMNHVKGISEYGLFYATNAAQTAEKIAKTKYDLEHLSKFLKISEKNYQLEKKQFEHATFTKCVQKASTHCSQLSITANNLVNLLQSSPDQESNKLFDDDKLSNLHKKHPEYKGLVDTAKKCKSVVNALVDFVQNKVPKNGDYCCKVWNFNETTIIVENVSKRIGELSACASKLSGWTPLYVEDMAEICKNISESFEMETNNQEKQTLWDEVDNAKLCIQNIYKVVNSQIEDITVGKKFNHNPIDDVKRILEGVNTITAPVQDYMDLVKKIIDGGLIEDGSIKKASDTCQLIMKMYDNFDRIISEFMKELLIFYVSFENFAYTLLEKGFVNTIPKEEDGETREGKNPQGGENAGMGEGQGENDVSDQIEESGQLEGLQGEKEEKAENAPEKQKDNEKPIDVEDEFAADLENMDMDENDENQDDNDDKDDGKEPEMDWNKGDIEEPEEKQLDPELWNKPEEEDEKDIDEGNEGVNEETDDFGARDENSANLPEKDEAKPTEGEDEEDGEDGDEKKTDEKDEGKDGDTDEEDHLENMNECDANDSDIDDNMSVGQDTEQIDDPLNENQEEPMDAAELEKDENEQTAEDLPPEMEMVNDGAQTNDDGEKVDDSEAHNTGQDNADNATENLQNENAEKDENQKEKEDTEGTSNENNQQELAEQNASNQSKKSKNIEQTKKEDAEKEKSVKDKEEKAQSDKKLADKADEVDDAESIEGRSDDEEAEDEDEDYLLAHNNRESKSERQIIKSATMEEAKNTRGIYDNRKYKQLKKEKESNLINENEDEAMEHSGSDENEEETFVESKAGNVIKLHMDNIDFDSVVDGLKGLMPTYLEDDGNHEENKKYDEEWSRLSSSIAPLAYELTEALRIIIEPSIASKLEGDYRSGKRLNMRRLISYIASGHRKDKIWMRRTKKAKRNYQVLLAIDDSGSMNENRIGEMTCQSTCLIEKALRQLEIGEIAVCKFGKDVKMVSDFSSQSESFGRKLLKGLNFDQDKTDLLNLLNVSSQVLGDANAEKPSNQMMIIVSDGHGVLSDGKEKLSAAIKSLIMQRVTVLFLILDNGKKSIMDMEVVKFNSDGSFSKTNYMDDFPFPFYTIMGNIQSLPSVVSEAIRQWFEFTTRA
uniref:Midasin n=1 Tax=Rhabditophanes sp. KR3021 TaxID=114890 RepID=A0AC35TJ71_9BILA